MVRAILSVFLPFVAVDPALADDPPAAGQRAAMLETARSLGIGSPAIVESTDLVLLSGLTETKLTPIANRVQKAIDTAKGSLKLAAREQVFPRKLSLYLLADAAELRKFVRQVEQRRPDAREYTFQAGGDTPYVAVSPEAGEKSPDLAATAATWAAATVLARHAGQEGRPPPEWLLFGFGRACHWQTLPTERRNALRSQVRAALVKANPPVWAKDIWGTDALPQRDLIAASVVEYLAFGPPAEKFPQFTKAMKPPAESDDEPSVEEALKTLELSPDSLDAGWKAWLSRKR